ncbi:MAG TPA: glycosyltransferase [Granulicella sp.]
MIAIAIMTIAVGGMVTSTIVLILSLVGAVKFRRGARRDRKAFARLGKDLPPISVLKPVHGNEARLKENIESFFRQDYPEFEILFAADEADDLALPVIRAICARYPNIPTRIIVTGKPPWPNAQNYCFHHLTAIAAHDILLTSDSDVEVGPDYLREVTAPLLDPKVGAVTCLFRGKNAGGFWAGFDAIGMSVEFTAGVLVDNLLEETKFGLGPTIVVRKDSIGKIGGFAGVRDYLSNDFVVGNFIYKAGYKVVLSGYVVDHVCSSKGFSPMWERQLRWAMGTRYSRPAGHFGSVLTFAVPFGILGLVAGWMLGHPWLGAGLFAASLLNRMVECWLIGWWAADDRMALRWVPLYPLRDLYGFVVWCASYMKQRMLWRDTNYRLLEGGKFVAVRADGSVLDPESARSITPEAGRF